MGTFQNSTRSDLSRMLIPVVLMATITVTSAPAMALVGLYKDLNHTGEAAYIGGDVPNLHDDGWGDNITSLKVLNGCRVRVYQHGNYGGDYADFTEDVSDLRDHGWNDKISSLKIYWPITKISPTSLSFGHLYRSDRDGAADHNEDQAQTITIENDGVWGTTLHWEAHDIPEGVHVSTTSGVLGDNNRSEDITVWLNPSSSGSFSDNFKIDNRTVQLSATVHGTPTVTFVGASKDPGGTDEVAIGVNDRVNLAVGQTVWQG